MPKVIVTAQVEDSANWENGFRNHAGLFNDYTATATWPSIWSLWIHRKPPRQWLRMV